MDTLHIKILKHLRKTIIRDLDIGNVIDSLLSEFILNNEDVETIESGFSLENQAQILLDILPSRGPDAFNSFYQTLRRHYKWITDDIDSLLKSKEVPDNNAKSRVIRTPILPPISAMVTRENKITQLRSELEKLKPHGYVVLHGMKGYGKSCLAANVLKDDKLLQDFFYNQIYWIKFGYEHSIEEDITSQLNILYHRVKNVEILSNSFKNTELKEYLIEFLKTYFSKKEERNALIVLHDVYNKKIIDAFDFGCKTLVITADIDVLDGKRYEVIQMNDGFTEAESLGLFAKVLDININKLPIEAKLIHKECKGMPILVNMFSAQFKEFKDDMKIRDNRWKYYLNSLRKKDTKNSVMGKLLEKQEAIFDICIERLERNLRKHYHELVIFSDDVNITTKTLEILWNKNEFYVDETMLHFCNKSLAVKQWNAELKCYIYCVHDLLLRHLKNKIKEEKLIQMHISFVEKYRKACDNNFAQLPYDNYSYSYIGHHLEQAKLYYDFPKLYLNFDFLQAKIKYSGLTDLLIDLNKYRKYITNNFDNNYEMKLNDLEQFLNEQASIISEYRHKGCLDLIQIAMNHPHPGYVIETAMDLAKKRSNYLYLSHDREITHINEVLSEEISTDISASSFTDNSDVILIGNNVGDIIQWDCRTKYQYVYSGYSNKNVIKKIVVSEKGDCFLALSDSGIVKLFILYNNDNADQYTQSPRQKQNCWSDLFQHKHLQDDSSLILSIDNEIILDMTFGYDDCYIAACSSAGVIKVWDRRGNCISRITNTLSSCLRSIAFTRENNLLHTMDETHGVLVTYRKTNTDYNYISQFNPQLEKKKIIFFHNVPEHDNSLIIVTETKAIYVKWFNALDIDHVHNYKKQIRAHVEDNNTIFVCAALTYDGQYLVIADSTGFVNIWNADSGFQPIAIYKSRASSLDTYWVEDEGYHLICGSENRLLHRWKLPMEEVHNSVKKPLFDAIVKSFGEKDIVAKETFTNKIIIFCGDQNIAELDSVDGKIIKLCLSSDGKKVVYITNKAIITLFDVDNKRIIDKLKLSEPTNFVKFLHVEDNEIIVFREGMNNLKVRQNAKTTFLVENIGYVIFIDTLNDKCIIIITQNGTITLWNITGTNWTMENEANVNRNNISIHFSCLNCKKNKLALLGGNHEMFLYELWEDTSAIKISQYFTILFTEKLTCCEFSQNEKYLAIGTETGVISIIDIYKKQEIHILSFHTDAITQLYWAPLFINVSLLLSVTSDNLAWWNIELININSSQKQRSRKGITRSSSSLIIRTNIDSSLKIPNSQSLDMPRTLLGIDNEISNFTIQSNKATVYWESKIGKDAKRPELLNVVQLPQSYIAKVCVSPDFSKLLTINIHGSISTFRLFSYT